MPLPFRPAGDAARRIPQAIAHRGYKALYPENTMLAFRSAVAAGAHAIETDLHLSADGHVVLSHDANLKRCFGVDKTLAECDWSYLKTLRSLRQPHEPLPRLKELLEWLADGEATEANTREDGPAIQTQVDPAMAAMTEPKRGDKSKVWLLLDVKTDDDPAELLDALKRTFKSVKRSDGIPWQERAIVACWSQPYLDAALAHLPSFHAAHTSFSPFNSLRFLRSPAYPSISFNMFQPALVGPLGAYFIRKLRTAPDAVNRHLFVWTVNDPRWMIWSIRKGVDGVITDDVAEYLKVVKQWEAHQYAGATLTDQADDSDNGPKDEIRGSHKHPLHQETWKHWLKLYLRVAVLQVFLVLATPILNRRHNRWQYKEPSRKRGNKA